MANVSDVLVIVSYVVLKPRCAVESSSRGLQHQQHQHDVLHTVDAACLVENSGNFSTMEVHIYGGNVWPYGNMPNWTSDIIF